MALIHDKDKIYEKLINCVKAKNSVEKHFMLPLIFSSLLDHSL